MTSILGSLGLIAVLTISACGTVDRPGDDPLGMGSLTASPTQSSRAEPEPTPDPARPGFNRFVQPAGVFAISYPASCFDGTKRSADPLDEEDVAVALLDSFSCDTSDDDRPDHLFRQSDMKLHVQPESDAGRPLVDDDPRAQEVTVDGMRGRFAFYRPGDPQWPTDDFGQELIAHAVFPLPNPIPWGSSNERTLIRISVVMETGSDTPEFRELFSTIIRSLEVGG